MKNVVKIIIEYIVIYTLIVAAFNFWPLLLLLMIILIYINEEEKEHL